MIVCGSRCKISEPILLERSQVLLQWQNPEQWSVDPQMLDILSETILLWKITQASGRTQSLILPIRTHCDFQFMVFHMRVQLCVSLVWMVFVFVLVFVLLYLYLYFICINNIQNICICILFEHSIYRIFVFVFYLMKCI